MTFNSCRGDLWSSVEHVIDTNIVKINRRGDLWSSVEHVIDTNIVKINRRGDLWSSAIGR